LTVQERPSYYIAANFRYKYRAVKAFRAISALLTEDRKLRVYLIRDPLHGWYHLSSWFVAIFGPIPALDLDRLLETCAQ
jgi:hypothetical protein